MSKKIWFGNMQHAAWVPCPSTGLQKSRLRYSVDLDYENGGGDVVSSAQWRNVYEIDLPVSDASAYDGIEVYSRFASGEYGNGYLYFADPMWGDYNLFSTSYAAPGLIEQGWRNWGSTLGVSNDPTFTTTTTNIYGHPSRTAVFTITATTDTFQGVPFKFLVPPGYTLHLGATGSSTGTGKIGVVDSAATLTAITPVSATTLPNFPVTIVGGSTGNTATVGIYRSSGAASTVSVTALRAQLLPTGSTPSVSRHVEGQGSTGLRFSGGNVAPENYVMADRHMIGMSLVLTECEAFN